MQTLNEISDIDVIADKTEELEAMNGAPIDYSDIPSFPNQKGRLYYQDFLDKLPPDIVKEMARRRLEDIKPLCADIPDRNL
jgi:hypothetical protein